MFIYVLTFKNDCLIIFIGPPTVRGNLLQPPKAFTFRYYTLWCAGIPNLFQNNYINYNIVQYIKPNTMNLADCATATSVTSA